MPDPVVIFRTHSPIEADVVKALLETHGIHCLVSSDVSHTVFPLSMSGPGEVRIAVPELQAAEASQIIADHRTEGGNGRLVRLRDEFEPLQDRIGYRFRDRGLLEHALTHRSRVQEDLSGGVLDNESLEFLGDAILGFCVADLLFHAFPDRSEGEKSKIKATLVSTASLARLAERFDLGAYLILGRGEEKTGGRRKQALLADAYEALIAAIYLDGGIEPVGAFIRREMRDLVEGFKVGPAGEIGGDYKSALQEWLQSRDEPLPEYRVAGEAGPDHRKLFRIEVRVKGQPLASAEGRSKKEAEQQAARTALEALKKGSGL